MADKPKWYEKTANLQLIILVMGFALLYYGSGYYVDEGRLEMVYGSIATIDEQLQEIEGDIRRFNEDDWKTVVPSIRDDAKQIRKLLDELKDRLEPIELPPDHDGPE